MDVTKVIPTPYVSIKVDLQDRCLPSDMLDWLEANVGPVVDSEHRSVNIVATNWDAWGLFALNGPTLVTFRFKDTRVATLFKLMWG